MEPRLRGLITSEGRGSRDGAATDHLRPDPGDGVAAERRAHICRKGTEPRCGLRWPDDHDRRAPLGAAQGHRARRRLRSHRGSEMTDLAALTLWELSEL